MQRPHGTSRHRRRGRPAPLIVLVAVLIVLAACAPGAAHDQQSAAQADAPSPATTSSPSPSPTQRQDQAGASPGTVAQPVGEDASDRPAETSGTAGDGTTDGEAESSPSPDPSSTANPTPQPMEFEGQDGVEFTSEPDPTCVIRGQAITITVQTEPEAAVAYHARYYGNEGGAEPPYGRGHGGNDKGFTDESGRYTSTWQIGPQAPIGPAIVDVVVAWNGKRGYDSPRFEVVESPDAC